MDNFKEFLLLYKKLALQEPYIILCNDVTPLLRRYVSLFLNIEFKDGFYHIFYGRIKKIINIFINFWTKSIDDAIQEIDKYDHTVDKNELLSQMAKTMHLQKYNEERFLIVFHTSQSTGSAVEQEIIKEMTQLYIDYMEKLNELKKKIEILNKDNIQAFTKEHFQLSLRRKSELINFAHTFMARTLSKYKYQIRVSIEEILLRVNNNLDELQEVNEKSMENLWLRLYDKNKERILINRQRRRNSREIAKVAQEIEMLHRRVTNLQPSPFVQRLENEVEYWTNKLNEFTQIEETIKKIEDDECEIAEQSAVTDSNMTTELPGEKRKCWQNIGDTFKERSVYIAEKKLEAQKALFTFFGVTGTDRVTVVDEIGPCWLDSQGHKVYVFEYGLKTCHINTDEKFVLTPDEDKYYFDAYGRYIIKNGEKLYQSEPCATCYRLGEDNLFVKVLKDGKDEQEKMPIKDYNDYELLPNTEIMDIIKTLDSETVEYLWGNFGSILPDALHDVGEMRPKNPITYLGHRLLFHRYGNTFRELLKKKMEAETFRVNTLKQRKDRDIAATKAWKAKQVKRRKPEESNNKNIEIAMTDEEFLSTWQHNDF